MSSIKLIRALLKRKFSKHKEKEVLVRAEPSPCQHEFINDEHCHLRFHTATTDGAWWCHLCRQENELIHFQGKNPFERLKCGRCDHVLCHDCHATDILQPLLLPHNSPNLFSVYRQQSDRYGVICRGCGLSWRAQRWKEGSRRLMDKRVHMLFIPECKCEVKTPIMNSIHFRIGCNCKWLHNQEQCHMEAFEKRLQQAPLMM